MSPTRTALHVFNNLRSRTQIPANLLLVAAFALTAFCLSEMQAYAQSGAPLSLGQVSGMGDPYTCPGTPWFSYTAGPNVYSMNCFDATIQSCTGAQNMGFTFGYISPSGIISGPVKGVIVYMPQGDGMVPVNNPGNPAPELGMLQYYFTQGYEIVQIAWKNPWEQTNVPTQSAGPNAPSVQNAACRPATFLNYVHTSLYANVSQSNSSAGMCAEGDSAGSAAIAYSMSYYGANGYLDNVELISGPVLSDIEQGCEEPAPSPVTVCPAGQYGCQLGTGGSSWSLEPTYLSGANGGVRNWTNDNTCAVPGGQTSGTSDKAWLKQSIVDQPPVSGGVMPTFGYPNTAISAWLCRSLKGQYTQAQCASNYDPQYCPNNSSSQGEIFYSQITQSNPPPKYNVYAVDSCGGPEGATDTGTNVPGFLPSTFANGINGFKAINYDMAGYTSQNPPINIPAHCVHPQ